MPITAEGPISLPLYKLAELLAETQECQEWCGLTYPDASAATTLIDDANTKHIWMPCTSEEITRLIDRMPVFAVGQSSPWNLQSRSAGASNWLRPAGAAELLIADIDRYPNDQEASGREFQNRVGRLLSQMGQLSGQGERLDFQSIDQVLAPIVCDQEEEASAGARWWIALYTIGWGIR
ncbi:MAG: hypothetical protein AB7O62_00375 [Pirellulales bacterium]